MNVVIRTGAAFAPLLLIVAIEVAAYASATDVATLPPLLSDTGLYKPDRPGDVASGNRPFAPQYPLWSDGAVKRRWVHLPEGATIDARDADGRPARETERAFVDAQWTRFLANLEHIGIPRAQFERWSTWPATVVRIRAESIFDQTPGPHAGAPLSGTA